MSDLKVVPIGVGNLLSIPDGLRGLANSIERGEFGAERLVWCAIDGDSLEIGALGPDVCRLRAAGLFQAAAVLATRKVVSG
jgi:hypothetical protein